MIDTPTRRPVRHSLVAFLATAALLVGACAAGAAPSANPSATPGTGSLARDDAVALVLASDPRFAGVGPLDPDLIGQSAWYEVSPATVGWRVTITKGWGDCQAGCISRHTWVFEVDPQGTVTLVEERGDPLEGGLDGGIDGGGVPPVAIPADGGPWIVGRALAGPTCPVAQEPPDPACADRPIVGAMVVVRDAGGTDVAGATTDEAGVFLVSVPGGGTYAVEAQPVEGVMGTPGPVEVVVPDGAGAWAAVDLGYDTGIR